MSDSNFAIVGEKYKFPIFRNTITIQKTCGENILGSWLCLSCGKYFTFLSLVADHLKKPGEHKIAWFCWKHGIEEPHRYKVYSGRLNLVG